MQVCTKTCPETPVIFRSQNGRHEMGTHYGCPSRAPKNETGIWPLLVGHDLTKFPSQDLKFSWEPDQPIFVRVFLVSALATTPTKVAKNESLREANITNTSPSSLSLLLCNHQKSEAELMANCGPARKCTETLFFPPWWHHMSLLRVIALPIVDRTCC